MIHLYKKNGSILLFSLIIGFSSTISSADITIPRVTDIKAYTLISGGGIDDLSLQLKDFKNRDINAYCEQHCGNWFVYNPESDAYSLKKKYQGAKVSVSLSYEQNRDRIAGPSFDEKLYFIKKVNIKNIP